MGVDLIGIGMGKDHPETAVEEQEIGSRVASAISELESIAHWGELKFVVIVWSERVGALTAGPSRP